MKQRCLNDDGLRTYAVVFDAGDDPVTGLARFARESRLDGASLTAIGAFSRVDIGWFDPDAHDYRVNRIREQVEVVSLVGDIARSAPDTTDPTVHVHLVLGRADGSALGGHLLAGAVRPTLEVIVTETPAHLVRRHDAATGLALIDLDAHPTTEPPNDTTHEGSRP